jgi:hypothetical protein
MTIITGLCTKCKRGYLVAEFSRSENVTNYYCNNCFKYADAIKKRKPRGKTKKESVYLDPFLPLGEWDGDRELYELLESIIKDY